MQQEIRSNYLSRATLYALLANALQFNKEATQQMAIAGSSKTRAMVCELLAIKLLKEYKTSELVEALSYDFDPLMGQEAHDAVQEHIGVTAGALRLSINPAGSATARISCLEIAIRAQAKHFLSHPLVVRQLEAIWAGNIVFHSVADNLHRLPADSHSNRPWLDLSRSNYSSFLPQGSGKGYSTLDQPISRYIPSRRSVTLYNPRDASLFKLSRLRVPRYRAALSTLSFAMLLVLYLAVLRRQDLEITSLELFFWFWSAGYMLDEVVGFNEQGFSLYIMSFWNVFDLGILVLLFSYACLRIASVLVGDLIQKQILAAQAYDVLASCAVLLLPRLFSVLDHVRYFSQLLIAFRMMAADLLAISILIVICCSGFFVAFTFAFNAAGEGPGEVVYDLFQMLMGFTPTAWAMWDRNNFAGRFVLVCFMFISHFLVVTILVTVLTNSFMAVVQNADEEHQFLFAVNTISMVKSDALFAYIAPTNVLAWIVAPLRFLMPFRTFVKLNRTIIKATHFPVLFSIYFYERFLLSRTSWSYVAGDFFEEENDQPATLHGQKSTVLGRMVREPSIATFRKDRALEEVFKKPYRGDDNRSLRSPVVLGLGIDLGQRSSKNNAVNVNTWMETLPEENSSSVRDFNQSADDPTKRSKIKRKGAKVTPRLGMRMHVPSRTYGTMRNRTDTTMSVASDPEDLHSSFNFPAGVRGRIGGRMSASRVPRTSLFPNYRPKQAGINGDDDEQHEGDDEDDDKSDKELDDHDDEEEEEEDVEDEEVEEDEQEEDGRSVAGKTANIDGNAVKDQPNQIRNSKRPVHHSSTEDEEALSDGEGSPKVLSVARGSRPATTANTSRRSSRPSTPRRRPAATINTSLVKPVLVQTSRLQSHTHGHSGSDSQGDETDGESEESEAVIMRSPPRNSGTANPSIANFAKRNPVQATKSSRGVVSSQRSGIGRGLNIGRPSGVPVPGPVLRSRSGSVSTTSKAWADDGQSTAAVRSHRPGFTRTTSHPIRHTGLTPSTPLPMAIDVASDLGDNKAIGGGLVGAVPASFATQMAYATGGLRREPSIERNTSTQDLLSRLVLARMKTLEEGFQQVVREVKDLRVRDEREVRREREREWERRAGRAVVALGSSSVPAVGPASAITQSHHHAGNSGKQRRPSRRRKSTLVGKGKEKARETRRPGSARSQTKLSNTATATNTSLGADTAASSDAVVAAAAATENEVNEESVAGRAVVRDGGGENDG